MGGCVQKGPRRLKNVCYSACGGDEVPRICSESFARGQLVFQTFLPLNIPSRGDNPGAFSQSRDPGIEGPQSRDIPKSRDWRVIKKRRFFVVHIAVHITTFASQNMFPNCTAFTFDKIGHVSQVYIDGKEYS